MTLKRETGEGEGREGEGREGERERGREGEREREREGGERGGKNITSKKTFSQYVYM